MSFLPCPPLSRRRLQRGLAVIEFALVAPLFFLLLLGVIEFARLLYVWDTVQEVTRQAARQAVVTDFTNADAMDAIRREAVFRLATDVNAALPAAPEITSNNVVVRYLNFSAAYVNVGSTSPAQNIVTCMADPQSANCIRYVEVCIGTAQSDSTLCDAVSPLSFVPLVGLFSYLGNLSIPKSTVRMPAESLGYRPTV